MLSMVAAKTVQPGLRPVGNAPLLVLRTTSPGGGSLLSAFLSANLSQSLYSAAKISPSGGDAAAGGRRGAFSSRRRRGCMVFPARKGGMPVFPRAKPGLKGFGFFILAAQPPTTTLSGKAAVKLKHPRGESPVKPENPHALQGASLKAQAPADGWAPPAAGRPPSLPQKKWSHALCTAPLYYIL